MNVKYAAGANKSYILTHKIIYTYLSSCICFNLALSLTQHTDLPLDFIAEGNSEPGRVIYRHRKSCNQPQISCTRVLHNLKLVELKYYEPPTSSRTCTMSRVVPGTGETIAAGLPASTFSNELFPAFGGPTSVPDIHMNICVYRYTCIYTAHTHTHTHTKQIHVYKGSRGVGQVALYHVLASTMCNKAATKLPPPPFFCAFRGPTRVPALDLLLVCGMSTLRVV